MSRHDDQARLLHMLDYAQTVVRLVSGKSRPDLDSDEMLRLALTRAVEVIGEAAAMSRIPPAPDFPTSPGARSSPHATA